jgi:hypothetical protein
MRFVIACAAFVVLAAGYRLAVRPNENRTSITVELPPAPPATPRPGFEFS